MNDDMILLPPVAREEPEAPKPSRSSRRNRSDRDRATRSAAATPPAISGGTPESVQAELRSADARRRKQIIRRVVLGTIALIVLPLLWVGVRAGIATGVGGRAAEESTRLNTALVEQDVLAATASIDKLQADAAEIRSLTGDPVWRAVELVPVLGSNLTTVRRGVIALDGVVTGALPALADLAGTVQITEILGERRDARRVTMLAAAPHLEVLDGELARAREQMLAIDTSSNVTALADAFAEVRGAALHYSAAVAGINELLALVPLLSAPDAVHEQLFTITATDAAGSSRPVAYLPVTVTGGRLYAGEPVAAQSDYVPDAAVEQHPIDLAAVRQIAEYYDVMTVDGAGDVKRDDIAGYLETGAYSAAPDEASAEIAIGRFAGAALTRAVN